MKPKVDSKGRVVVPDEERVAWQAKKDDAVRAEISSASGASGFIRDSIDSKGRITIPKDKRLDWQIEQGDRVKVRIVEVHEGGYECEDCGGNFDLGKVLIVEGGDRIVCAECSKPHDRVI